MLPRAVRDLTVLSVTHANNGTPYKSRLDGVRESAASSAVRDGTRAALVFQLAGEYEVRRRSPRVREEQPSNVGARRNR